MRNEYIATSDTVMKVSTKYGVEDANFDVDKWSYAISTFWTGADSQKIFTSPFMTYANWWWIIKNTTKNEYDFNPVNWPTYKTFAEKTPFVFSLTAVNNQYATTTYTGVITLPDILPSSINQVVTTGDSVLRKYANTYVFSTGTILAGSGIILSNSATGITKFNGRGWVSMETQTGATYIVSLDSATGTMNWNGGFIIGEDIATGTFLPTYATVTDMGLDLKEFHVDKLVRIWSDVLGIGMQLSQPVSISFTWISPDTTYTLLTSEDGIHWSRHSTPQVTTTSSGTVIFSTDHFSLFALTEEPPTPLCNLSINPTPIANGTQATFSWTTLNASGITLNNGIWNVTSYGVQSGSMLSIPPVNSTTEYILTATNPYGSAICKATVVTKAPPSCSVASDVTDIKNGWHVLLSWTGMHTDTGFLIPNNINIPSIGNITTIPPMNTTTNYTLQVSNDVGTSSCSTVITTYPNSAPIAQDDIVWTTQNISNFFPILENDIDSNTWDSIVVKDIVSQASHGIAEIAGSTIHYTPTPAYCWTDTFMYRIQDNDGAVSNTATVTVNISCWTNAPVVDSLAFSGTEDANITSTLSGSDADGDPIQFHLLVWTASGTVVSTGLTQSTVHGSVTLATDGSFVYTPNPNFNGSDSFLYTATDGYYSGNTATAVLTVLSVNDAPIAVSDSWSTNKDITTVIHILANDIDPDHAILSLTPTIISQPISGTITLSGLTNASWVSLGTVAYYTPYSGYCGGQDSFTYRLTDGSWTVSIPTIVTVDVMCTNDPPTAINDTVILNEDTSFNINSLINDTDQNIVQGPSFITGEILRIDGITASPLYGTAVIVPNSSPIGGNSGISSDSIMYTPNSNYCGTDMLSYRTRDSMGNISNSAMVMITIICINDVPTSQSLTLSGVVNLESTNPLILTGLLQVADIDHSTWFTYALTTTPVFGTASIQNTTGMFSYTPILGFTGTETLPFTVTDASGWVSSVRYITVLYTSAPQIVSFSGTITSSTGQVSLLSGSTKTSLPSWYTLDLTGRTITAISRPVDLGFSWSSTISWTNLLPGSIVIPWTTKITVDGGIWSGEILAPTKIASNQSEHIILTDSGVSAALPINTSTMTYTYTPVDTIKAGSTGASLALSGGNATIEYIVNSPGIVFGSTLRILRSQDGNTWVPNFPDTACIIDNEMKCTFQTNHLTYFGIVEVISTPIQTSIIASAGAWGYSPYIPTWWVSMNWDINSMDRVSSSNIVTFSWLLLPDAFAKSQKKNIADSNIWVNGSSMNEIQTDLQPNDTQIITYSTLYSRKQVLFVKKYRGIYSDQFMTNIIFWSILRNYSWKSERTDVVKSIKDDLYSLSVTNPAISSVDLSQDASYNDSYLNVADLIENLWEKKKPKMK
jgi:hypothetical protein